MAELFDKHDKSFGADVRSSIDFSGLPCSFFTAPKVEAPRELIATRLYGMRNPHMRDVGSGVGEFHPFVQGTFGRICGADVSDASIAQAQIRSPEVQYETYVGETLPYESAAFDLSIAICVLHHVPPTLLGGFLCEMRRVVRPGGLVCLIEHNPLNPLTKLIVVRCEFDRDAVLLRPVGRVR
jgi:SAM-dependent methyltransferase